MERDLRNTLANITMLLAIIMSWTTPYDWYIDLLIIFVMIMGGAVAKEAQR